MNRYNRFFQGIAQELHIRQGKHEDLISYQCRIVYSVLGRMATASLWDTLEDGKLVSIDHFKKRINQAAYGYSELYPELRSAFSGENLQIISKGIYEILSKAGYFYHEPYRIAPCIPCGSSVGELYFTRGMPLGKPQFVSGLGSYQNRPNGIDRIIPVEEMYHFGCSDIFLPWKEITANPVWEPLSMDSNVEYLRLTPPFSKEYWVKKPDSNIVSLCRVTTQGTSRYYLYLTDHTQVLCSPIPEWALIDPVYVDDTGRVNYRLYSNSLLANLGSLPPTRYHIDGETVSIEVRYLFPAMEMNFVKLYSWPQSFYNPDSPFKRVFDRDVFLAVKETLENQGYCFVEV